MIFKIIATRRFRFFFFFNCKDFCKIIYLSNKNFFTNLISLITKYMINKLLEMFFVIFLIRILIFSFAIIFFFFILINFFHFSLFSSLLIVILMTTRSFLFVFSINFFIESFNLLLVNTICVINLQSILHSLFFSKKFDALDFWLDEIFKRLLF